MTSSLALSLYLATRARADRSPRSGGSRGEDPAEAAERRGQAMPPRGAGPLIWFHTGQDGDGTAARELARRMAQEREDLGFLFTTSAPNRLGSQRNFASQFVPDDALPAVRRFLDHWRPSVAVWTEPDLRPALIAESAERRVPLYLFDARTAKPDPQSWRWLPGLTAALLTSFRRILTGSVSTAATLRRLGARPERIETAGFLEEGTPALTCNEHERDVLAAGLKARPVWLAAAVGEDELEPVLQAHDRARRQAHRLLLILVPARPADGPKWHAMLQERGLRTALRSDGDEPDAEAHLFVADSEGEMGLWYRLAPISFLGQSLGSAGGINPFEAAALGSAILHGPDIRNFQQAYAKLGAAGATRLVRTADDLGEAVELLLSPDLAARMAHEAWAVCSSGAEVTDRAIDLILTELDELEFA